MKPGYTEKDAIHVAIMAFDEMTEEIDNFSHKVSDLSDALRRYSEYWDMPWYKKIWIEIQLFTGIYFPSSKT